MKAFTTKTLALMGFVALCCSTNSFAQRYYPVYPSYSYPSYSYPSNYPSQVPSSTYYSSMPQNYYADEGALSESVQNTSELGLRYLKLSNTYRESGNFDMAQFYASRGLNLVRGRGSRYWEAVGNEYLGLIYRDAGDRLTALEYLREAERLYRTVISPMRSESSLDAVQKIVSDVDYGWRYISRPASFTSWYSNYSTSSYMPSGVYSGTSSSRILPRTYSIDVFERERLMRANMLLQSQLSELELRLRQLEQMPAYPGR
ncbi:MAG: tetratricopeptide repeat protein [Candidatus Kapabacteria bacterium]|nr:tetratricopeptide repeat protein [Candidatus Kapabacteria bacterium]